MPTAYHRIHFLVRHFPICGGGEERLPSSNHLCASSLPPHPLSYYGHLPACGGEKRTATIKPLSSAGFWLFYLPWKVWRLKEKPYRKQSLYMLRNCMAQTRGWEESCCCLTRWDHHSREQSPFVRKRFKKMTPDFTSISIMPHKAKCMSTPLESAPMGETVS